MSVGEWEFYRIFSRYKGRLFMCGAMMVALTGINIVIPLMVGMVFDKVFPEKNWNLLWIILGILLAAYLGRNLFYFLTKYLSASVGENLCFELRSNLFQKIQQISLRYHKANNPGQLSSRVMSDTSVIQQFIQSHLPKIVQSALLFVGLLVTMFFINWQLAGVAAIILPFQVLTFNQFKNSIKEANRDAQAHLAGATGNLFERFLGMEVVKGFGAEERERRSFEQAIDHSRRSRLRGKRMQAQQKVAADLLIGLGTIVLIGFGAYQVMAYEGEQAMHAGEFIAFFWFVKMLYPTISELANNFGKLFQAMAGIERVSEILAKGKTHAGGGTGVKTEIRGEISFQDVNFSYPDNTEVLDGVNFHIPAGEVCAVTGPSGVGKSTLVSLIPRFNDVSSGRILMDGTEIRDIDLSHLRANIGIAFQECFLFSTSVFENLVYGRPDATEEEIRKVAERIGTDEAIRQLPHGYDTVVGEEGVVLSRGQKQLITVTRAMIKHPRILILDEATASIDEERESVIIPSILKEMQDRTVVMVVPETKLLPYANKVVELRNGSTVQYETAGKKGRQEPPPRACDAVN